MQTLILFLLTLVVGWILFKPATKKELDRFSNKDNWSNMGF